jgi:ATP-binding cassette subfamily F protein uup
MATNLINLEEVTVAHGTKLLLDKVSLGVADNDRIGVVGRNGGGKTTLLKTLVKTEEPHSGRVTHAGGLRVGGVATFPRQLTHAFGRCHRGRPARHL